MCSPAVIAAVALGTAQAGLSIQGQRQQAKTQAKMQQKATIQEQQRHLQELGAMRMKERQEAIAFAQERQQITKKAREARATARVSAGEAGVAGLSVDALLDSFTQNEANAQFSITQQQLFSAQNQAFGLSDAAMRTRGNLMRINKPIEQPNYLGAVLDGAQTGMSMYSLGKESGANDWINSKFK